MRADWNRGVELTLSNAVANAQGGVEAAADGTCPRSMHGSITTTGCGRTRRWAIERQRNTHSLTRARLYSGSPGERLIQGITQGQVITHVWGQRVIGTIRRECVYFLITTNQRLRRSVREFVSRYNRGRSHSFIISGQADPRHIDAVLGGLHRKYGLEKEGYLVTDRLLRTTGLLVEIHSSRMTSQLRF